MAKIYLTCPECGCSNWIVRDDEEAEGAFECGACGELVFTEDMGAEVEEFYREMEKGGIKKESV